MRPSLVLFEELKQWLNVATPQARRIARKIIVDSPVPLHTHEIYQRSQRDFPLEPQEEEDQRLKYARLLRRTGPPPPPNGIHHIRSIRYVHFHGLNSCLTPVYRYLKGVVLPDLEKRNEIVKVHQTRSPTPEEREIAATLKPPTLSQRKRRGAVGPGKQPTRLTSGGEVSEWVWRLKTTEDYDREAFLAERERQNKELADKQRKEARIAKGELSQKGKQRRKERV